MELAIIITLLIVIATMGTIIVFLRKVVFRQKLQIEQLKEGLVNAFNAITHGRNDR